MMSRILAPLACVAALLFFSVVQAQPSSGTIRGTVVSDDERVSFRGATVEIVGTDRSTSTDREGRFRFSRVEPGQYDLRARYVGAPAKTVSVTVSAGETR